MFPLKSKVENSEFENIDFDKRKITQSESFYHQNFDNINLVTKVKNEILNQDMSNLGLK